MWRINIVLSKPYMGEGVQECDWQGVGVTIVFEVCMNVIIRLPW